jgi:hypothetical protein
MEVNAPSPTRLKPKVAGVVEHLKKAIPTVSCDRLPESWVSLNSVEGHLDKMLRR